MITTTLFAQNQNILYTTVNAGPDQKTKTKNIMTGLEPIFPTTHIVLWQLEYLWREKLTKKEKKSLFIQNLPYSCELLHLAAIVVDTKDFREVKSYHTVLTSPFADEYSLTKLILHPHKEPEILSIKPFTLLAQDFFRWSRGYDLYSWGEDYTVISQNTELEAFPDYVKSMKFHDLRHLFKAFGVPADQYLSSNVIEYFVDEPPKITNHPLDNCRILATALNELAKTL